MNIVPMISASKQYDHEEDREEEEQDGQSERNQQQLQQLEDDYNFAKLTADINDLYMQTKSHEQSLRHIQKEIDSRVTESHLSEVIALINAGIQTDPNLMKLLKTKQGITEEETSKSKMNSLAFSRKLNQMNECLSVLLAHIRKLESRITSVESDLVSQMNEKLNTQQIQVEEFRSEQIKDNMELQQKMELMSFELSDKVREVETKTTWKLNEFKSKIDQKISEEYVKQICEALETRVDKSMREYQLSSNIDPRRIEEIQNQLQVNYAANEKAITQCEYDLAGLRSDIASKLVRMQFYEEERLKVEKRLDLFNSNFTEVYTRVKTCETEEKVMSKNIDRLLTDTSQAIKELSRINTVLTNLKIGEDFQRMLAEMNPTKVLELQDRVDGVHNEQRGIFREIQLAKREIDKINAKADVMGVMLPNQMRDKFKKEELEEALTSVLNDHQFTHKIANIDRQLSHYKLSIESIQLLSKQVARIQKEDQSHKVTLELRMLEERIKKEIALIHSQLKEKGGAQYQDRLVPKGGTEAVSTGPILQSRSFSVKKMGKVNSVYSSSGMQSLAGKQR